MTGEIQRKDRRKELRLERKTLERTDLIILNRDLCNGCGICAEVCVKNAISSRPGLIESGRLLRFPSIDIDIKSCIMCGICAVICPLNACEAWVNDEEKSMFVEKDAFPSMIRKISVNNKLCKPDCEIKCEEVCPTEAINVLVVKHNNHICEIKDVQVNHKLCIYCMACEYACPKGAIIVKRPFESYIRIQRDKCPKNCQICEDVCPSNAIKIQEGVGPILDYKLCISCKACQTVCPEGAIHVHIERISHIPIQSSTWISILQLFASNRSAAKELAGKSTKKRVSRITTLLYSE